MSDDVMVRLRCGFENCGKLMAEVAPAGIDGRLVLRQPTIRYDKRTRKMIGDIPQPMQIPDPRAWGPSAIIPGFPMACRRLHDREMLWQVLADALDEYENAKSANVRAPAVTRVM